MTVSIFTVLVLLAGASPEDIAGHKRAVALLRTMPMPGRDKATAGVGFLVEHEGDKTWMITCAHVVKDADAVRADFSDSLKFIVVEAYIDEGHDQALLKLEKAAPANAKPFKIRLSDVPEVEQKFTVFGFARGVGPHVTAVSAAYHAMIDAQTVGIPRSAVEINPKAQFLEVGVVGEPGASGSAMVDGDFQLVGVYSAGWKGRSDIGYASVRRTVADLQAAGRRVQMNRERDKNLRALDNFDAYNLKVLFTGSEQRGATPTSLTTAGEVSISEWYARYLATSDVERNREIKQFIDAKFTRGGPKVIHVQNWPLNVGLLVPEGYEIVERVEPHHGYSLTISRPGSLYEAKLYARPLPNLPADLKKEARRLVKNSASSWRTLHISLRCLPARPVFVWARRLSVLDHGRRFIEPVHTPAYSPHELMRSPLGTCFTNLCLSCVGRRIALRPQCSHTRWSWTVVRRRPTSIRNWRQFLCRPMI